MSEIEWEQMGMVLGVAALAAGSVTEAFKRAIQQGIIERRGVKPWWRGTALRVVSITSGAVCGWLLLPESPRLGVLLGVGSGQLTTEAVAAAKRFMGRNGKGLKPRSGGRLEPDTEFGTDGSTEFRPAITEEDLER